MTSTKKSGARTDPSRTKLLSCLATSVPLSCDTSSHLRYTTAKMPAPWYPYPISFMNWVENVRKNKRARRAASTANTSSAPTSSEPAFAPSPTPPRQQSVHFDYLPDRRHPAHREPVDLRVRTEMTRTQLMLGGFGSRTSLVPSPMSKPSSSSGASTLEVRRESESKSFGCLGSVESRASVVGERRASIL